MSAPGTKRPVFRWGIGLACAALACGYLAVAAMRAANTPMWLDECYALNSAIRHQPLADLLLGGATGQGSPSPLDYLLVRGLDRARETVRYLGLPAHAYFRLVSLLATVAAGAFAFALTLLAGGRTRTPGTAILVTALGVCAFLAFGLDARIFHFSGEMRPYALWTALWLVAALSLLQKGRASRVLCFVSLILLSITATASMFQLAALAVATLAVEALGRTALRTAVGNAAALFAVPFALCLLYSLRVRRGTYPESLRTWAEFSAFWASHWWVAAVALAALVLCLMDRDSRAYAVPPLAMLVVYLLGPAVLWATRIKGFFFTERQYLYYWTAVPIACVTCAFALAARGAGPRRGARDAVAALALLLCLAGTAHAVWRTVPALARSWPQWRWTPGVPADPEGRLAGLLARELPRDLCFADAPSDEARTNISLVAEWLPVRYPSLPVGRTSVLLAAHGDGAEVRALRDGCGSNDSVPVIVDRPR